MRRYLATAALAAGIAGAVLPTAPASAISCAPAIRPACTTVCRLGDEVLHAACVA
jgi:hypothetical protein